MTWRKHEWLSIADLVTVSELNQREHYQVRRNRAFEQRQTTLAQLRDEFPDPVAISSKHLVVIGLTRISPSELDDDNLQSALKHIRDGVADWLGVDDRSPHVRWDYSQVKGPMGIRIEITPVAYVCAHCGGHGWTTR